MHPRTILSIGSFFFSIFSSLVTLILLPYLSLFMPSAYAGFVLAGSALGAVILFPFLPALVERHGAKRLALTLALIETAVLFTLATVPGVVTSVLLIAVTIAVQPFLSYSFDLLVEAVTADTATVGRTRALFRTVWSIAALAGPLLLGALLVDADSYGRIFIVAAATLAPLIIFFSANHLPKGPAPKFEHMKDTVRHIFRNRDLGAVTFGNLLLYLFLVWMPVYTPLYLHDVIGISWANLGWIFSVMLLPYIFLEYPASWIADRYVGDKEMMLGGFLIAGVSLAALAFLTPASSLVTILVILLCSRVGAALIEAMVDAHFFRRVSKRDINSVSVFRSVWPLAYFIGPILASGLLVCGGYSTLFLVTGAFIVIAGTASTLLIKDFK
jgi:MFS family permease